MSKKLLGAVFVLVLLGSALLYSATTSAFTVNGKWENAVYINLESFEFENSDINNSIKESTVLSFAGQGGNTSAGLTEINRIIARDVTGLYPDVNPLDSGSGERRHERKNGDCNTRFEWNENGLRLVDLSIKGPEGNCVQLLDNERDLILYNGTSITLLDDFPKSYILFEQVSDTQIIRVDEEPNGNAKKGLFTRDPSSTTFPNRYFQDDGDEYVDVSAQSGATYGPNVSGASYSGYSGSVNWRIALLDANGETTGVSNNIDPTLEASPETDTCNEQGGAFSFLLCEGIVIAGNLIEDVDGEIEKRLSIDSDYYESDQLQAIWGRVRNIAYILLIPTLLIMVIGTALGFQFIDAYTVKRAMPRLLAAVIFMALSYDICVLLIEIVNNVGAGVKGIVAAPFGGAENLGLESIFNPDGQGALSQAGTFATVTVLAGIGLVTAVSVGIIFSYLLIAALVILIVFILLAMRELFIISLIILAPLAILSWIFPGNDKPWKLWWGSFWKLLALYPIIIGLLWMGRGFAKIVAEVGADSTEGPIEGAFLVLVKLVAYIGPFFFILAVFKWAGGAFANLSGIMNDRSKGVFDRQKKYRADKRKQLRDDLAAENRFKGNSKLGSWVNKRGANTLGRIEAAKRSGARGAFSKSAVEEAKAKALFDHEKHAKEDGYLSENSRNDDFLIALQKVMDGKSKSQVIEELELSGYGPESARNLYARASAAKREYGSHALAGMTIAGKVGAKTSDKNGMPEFLQDIVDRAHGDENLAMKYLGEGLQAAAAAGRHDIAGGSFGEKVAMLRSMMYGSPVTYDNELTGEKGLTMTAEQAVSARQGAKAFESFDYAAASRLHPRAAKNMTDSLVEEKRLQTQIMEDAGSTDQQRIDAAKRIGELDASLDKAIGFAASSGNAEVTKVFTEARGEDKVSENLSNIDKARQRGAEVPELDDIQKARAKGYSSVRPSDAMMDQNQRATELENQQNPQ